MLISEYIKDNLLACYRQGTFTKEQIAVFATNHLTAGKLSEADVLEIADTMEGTEA
jgi:hypothetical protein